MTKRGGVVYRHYKTKRGALKYRDLLRATIELETGNTFGIVPDRWGWAVALFEDGKVRALCA